MRTRQILVGSAFFPADKVQTVLATCGARYQVPPISDPDVAARVMRILPHDLRPAHEERGVLNTTGGAVI